MFLVPLSKNLYSWRHCTEYVPVCYFGEKIVNREHAQKVFCLLVPALSVYDTISKVLWTGCNLYHATITAEVKPWLDTS